MAFTMVLFYILIAAVVGFELWNIYEEHIHHH